MPRPKRITRRRRPRDDVFDVHLHAFAETTVFERAAEANFGPHRVTGPVTPADRLMDETLAYMDRNRVRVALVSGDRQAVLEWATRHPDRFLASFVPDFTAKDHGAAAARFEEEIQRGTWYGMGELPLPYHGIRLNDEALFPYYEVCERRGLPVAFHTGLDGPEPQRLIAPPFRVEYGDPLLLQDVLARFPRLRVIVMHMGWPFFDHALYLLYAYRNVYVDTGVVDWILSRFTFHRMLTEAVKTAGSERVLFGTDQMAWPRVITPAVRAILEAKGLTHEDRRKILWNNAAELFRAKGKGGR